jgi:predicted NBD/HSP70 family sugar kinase
MSGISTHNDSAPVLVYDVGGSHISAALCDPHTYALRGISRAPLPSSSENNLGTGHFSFASFCRLIHTLGEATANAANTPLSSVCGAGLAMPGPFDYERGISQMRHKLPALFGVDLKSSLARRFGWQPSQLRFVNDAAAFLLGEVGAGAAKGYSRAIGITLGTGIGCAFAVNGHIAIPSDRPGGDPGVPPGGEIWNLPYNGATVEDFVSTRFLRLQYQSVTGLEAEVSEVAAIAQCIENQPCPELDAKLAQQAVSVPPSTKFVSSGSSGVPLKAARQAFQDFGRHLGLALNQHAAAFAPDVIVLGGGISRASHLFLPATRKALIGFSPKIAISLLMDEAPLAGAGLNWFDAAMSTS